MFPFCALVSSWRHWGPQESWWRWDAKSLECFSHWRETEQKSGFVLLKSFSRTHPTLRPIYAPMSCWTCCFFSFSWCLLNIFLLGEALLPGHGLVTPALWTFLLASLTSCLLCISCLSRNRFPMSPQKVWADLSTEDSLLGGKESCLRLGS